MPERFANALKVAGPGLVGSVVFDVEDRDFSQLEYTATHIGDPDKFFVFVTKDLVDKLPNGHFMNKVVAVERWDEKVAYALLDYYVPIPRLTDYRYKVCPPEIIQAMALGARPMLINHPALEPLFKYINLVFVSLESYQDAFYRVAMSHIDQKAGILQPFNLEIDEHQIRELLIEPEEFGSFMNKTYEQGVADAPKGA